MEHTRDHTTVTDAGDLLVVILTQNDQESVGHVVQELQSVFDSATILVADRQSSDETVARAQAAGAKVLSVGHDNKADADQLAYRYAVEHGYQVVAHADAHGCYPAQELSMLVEMVRQGADLVIGSRFQQEGAKPRLFHRAAVGVFRFYTNLREGQKLSDPLSNMRATSARLSKRFADYYPSTHAELDSVTHALRDGYSVKEVPVIMLPDAQPSRGRDKHSGAKLLGHTLKCMLTLGPRRLGPAPEQL